MVKAYLDCLSREDAEALWWKQLTSIGYFRDLPSETVAIGEALGRVTARSIYACQSVPHYNGAAMDGIAVCATDTFGAAETNPKRLVLLSSLQPFQQGACYIIDTGDPLPAGTNAVIMREDIYISGEHVEITAAAVPWQHVRIIGEDIVANEMVLPEQRVIYPADIAALLAAGLDTVEVTALPQVSVIPTGTELVSRKEELQAGKILDVNSHMICAAVKQWGGIARGHPVVPDDYYRLKQAVIAALETSDMVITNAGTSAGTEDFTSTVLAELGEVLVHGVAIKPGKPVILAICRGKPVIGLPGYPVSAMLTAELFVKPVLRERQKLPRLYDQETKAVLTKQTFSSIGTEEYIRVSVGNVNGKTIAAPLSRGAGLITSLTKSSGILTVKAGSDGIQPGVEVNIRLIRPENTENSLIAIGSHDLSLDILGVYLKRRSGINLSCANVGSMGGIMAVRSREAHLAGIHILDPDTGEYNIACVRNFLGNTEWCLIALGAREQGIITAPGNPKGIVDIADLAREDVTIVNRQRGSGTRLLLDYKLNKLAIECNRIQGYDKEVGTHMAVAASIASGMTDAGLGVRAAANALGLGFIPVGYEKYDLLLGLPASDKIAALISGILTGREFRAEVEALGGYDLAEAGLVRAEGDCHGS